MSLRLIFLRATLWLASLWLGLMPLAFAQATGGVLPVPALTARVIDQTGTLLPEQRQQLEAKLAAFETEKGTQVVILLVPTTQPEDIASYANRIFNVWKPGRKGIGDGLLLVVAKQDRNMRIEVARALEGAVPDLATQRIINESLKPHFRKDDFAGGLDLAIEQLMGLVRGEALPAPAPARSPDANTDWLHVGVVLFIALSVLGTLARHMLGNKLGALTTGGVIGFLAYFFTTSLLLAGAAAFGAMLFCFISGTPLGAALLPSGQRYGAGLRGGGLGGGGFGGGGGGFSSGGGGDGAGGGSSGSW
jgi:uncharacterized protein